jgi:hypothetical protein
MIPISLTMMQNIAAPRRWSTAQSLQATDITSNMLNIPASFLFLEKNSQWIRSFCEHRERLTFAMVLEELQVSAVQPIGQHDDAIAPLSSSHRHRLLLTSALLNARVRIRQAAAWCNVPVFNRTGSTQ